MNIAQYLVEHGANIDAADGVNFKHFFAFNFSLLYSFNPLSNLITSFCSASGFANSAAFCFRLWAYRNCGISRGARGATPIRTLLTCHHGSRRSAAKLTSRERSANVRRVSFFVFFRSPLAFFAFIAFSFFHLCSRCWTRSCDTRTLSDAPQRSSFSRSLRSSSNRLAPDLP